jgi:phytoene desaturase
MKPLSVVVIGAGIGGMVAATHLARRGINVTVIEKNSHAGGRCDHFTRDGHRFDTGPTLLVMPKVYEAEFAALGSSLHEALDLQRVDPTYNLVFDDGSQFALTSDLKRMQEQLEAIERGSFSGFLRYLEEGHRHYDLAMGQLVNRDFRTAADFFTINNLPLLFSIKPLVQHYQNMSTYFREPRLKAAFTFQDVYMGLSPFEAPATFSMMPYTELAHGVWYPRGGMYRIVEALEVIARRAGVEFAFKTTAKQIEISGMRASAVVLATGQRLEADAILANADLPYVYESLLPDEKLAETIAHKRFSCSVISFFWGVDKPYSSLGPHTLFLADDFKGNFESITHNQPLPENPCLYIHAPARLDASMAPAGQDTLTAIVPIAHLGETTEQDWDEIKDQARKSVFNRLKTLGITDLEVHLKFEVCYTPLSWHRHYNLMKGATHGLCHNLTQLGYFRPHNRHPRYANLYFAGASTHPGTGVPTAFISGRLVAQRMVEECLQQSSHLVTTNPVYT